MGYIIKKKGRRIERHQPGPVRLAAVLTDDEYERFQGGNLVAINEGGGLLSLSSPLVDGQEITLRPPSPRKDFADYGFPVNRAGELVGISELIHIRSHEEEHDDDVFDLPLVEIRRRLAGRRNEDDYESAAAVSLENHRLPTPIGGAEQVEAPARIDAAEQVEVPDWISAETRGATFPQPHADPPSPDDRRSDVAPRIEPAAPRRHRAPRASPWLVFKRGPARLAIASAALGFLIVALIWWLWPVWFSDRPPVTIVDGPPPPALVPLHLAEVLKDFGFELEPETMSLVGVGDAFAALNDRESAVVNFSKELISEIGPDDYLDSFYSLTGSGARASRYALASTMQTKCSQGQDRGPEVRFDKVVTSDCGRSLLSLNRLNFAFKEESAGVFSSNSTYDRETSVYRESLRP